MCSKGQDFINLFCVSKEKDLSTEMLFLSINLGLQNSSLELLSIAKSASSIFYWLIKF